VTLVWDVCVFYWCTVTRAHALRIEHKSGVHFAIFGIIDVDWMMYYTVSQKKRHTL